jgi:hypothetical protein
VFAISLEKSIVSEVSWTLTTSFSTGSVAVGACVSDGGEKDSGELTAGVVKMEVIRFLENKGGRFVLSSW